MGQKIMDNNYYYFKFLYYRVKSIDEILQYRAYGKTVIRVLSNCV